MGMSASQARLISLQARQSNLEYQGQQINQERTILSQQCTDLYNSLLNMSVPTPPSTQDYTTVKYVGTNNATDFTLGTIVPTGSSYTINFNYTKTGNALESKGKGQVISTPKNITVVTVSKDDGKTERTYAETSGEIGENKPDNETDFLKDIKFSDKSSYGSNAEYYVKDNNGKLVKTAYNDLKSTDDIYVKQKIKNAEGDDEANYDQNDLLYKGEETETKYATIKRSELGEYLIKVGENEYKNATTEDFDKNEDGTYTLKSGFDYVKKASEGTEIPNPEYTEGIGLSIGSNSLFDWDSAEERITDTDKETILKAIKNTYPEYKEKGDSELLNMFYYYFTMEGNTQVPHLVLNENIKTMASQGDNGETSKWVEFFDITTSGKYTESIKQEGCDLTFDSTGRIIGVSIPVTDSKGNVSYKEIPLEAEKTTDNAAYEDAMAAYEYAQYEYDKEQQDINARTEIIQKQDRNLELKLQRLDNERTQIKTEIEALDKVINENIEKSYKTFSG